MVARERKEPQTLTDLLVLQCFFSRLRFQDSDTVRLNASRGRLPRLRASLPEGGVGGTEAEEAAAGGFIFHISEVDFSHI